MAARLKKFHQEEVRAKIQASQLVNRLTDHALSKCDLSATQIKAIEILLKKSVPDLSAITLEGPGEGGEHIHKVVREVVRPSHTNG